MRPEETVQGRTDNLDTRELFATADVEENFAESITNAVHVLNYQAFQDNVKSKKYHADRTYLCRYAYNTDTNQIRPLVSDQDSSATALIRTTGKRAPVNGDNKYAAACQQLQLNAAPDTLPCREIEHDYIYHFIRNALQVAKDNDGSAGALCKYYTNYHRTSDVYAFHL